jgi:hypothetical protein
MSQERYICERRGSGLPRFAAYPGPSGWGFRVSESGLKKDEISS